MKFGRAPAMLRIFISWNFDLIARWWSFFQATDGVVFLLIFYSPSAIIV